MGGKRTDISPWHFTCISKKKSLEKQGETQRKAKAWKALKNPLLGDGKRLAQKGEGYLGANLTTSLMGRKDRFGVVDLC